MVNPARIGELFEGLPTELKLKVFRAAIASTPPRYITRRNYPRRSEYELESGDEVPGFLHVNSILRAHSSSKRGTPASIVTIQWISPLADQANQRRETGIPKPPSILVYDLSSGGGIVPGTMITNVNSQQCANRNTQESKVRPDQFGIRRIF